MKNIITIVKKELKRFFTDRRMVLTLILPGLLIFVLYSLMGSFMSDMYTVGDDYTTTVSYIGEMPTELDEAILALKDVNFKVEATKALDSDIESIKEKIQNGEIDLLIIFPLDFNLTAESESNVELYYNSIQTTSYNAFINYKEVINSYRCQTTYLYNLNANSNIQYDMASEKDISGKIFATLLPLLIIMFLFSGCMAVTPESISGEKERGTIATLLVTPMKRSELAIGKIISLSIVSLVSAISSTVGTILSLPKLMAASGSMTFDYGFSDYLAIFLIIISMVLVIVSLMAIISTFAKSVKEASSLVLPLMIIVMLIGLSSMLFSTPPSNALLYCIPLFSGVQNLSGILTFNINWLHVFISVGSSIGFTLLFVYVLVRMFNNEKIIFNK